MAAGGPLWGWGPGTVTAWCSRGRAPYRRMSVCMTMLGMARSDWSSPGLVTLQEVCPLSSAITSDFWTAHGLSLECPSPRLVASTNYWVRSAWPVAPCWECTWPLGHVDLLRLGIHMSLPVRHIGWRPFFLNSWEGACLERFLCRLLSKNVHPAFIITEASCFVLLSIAIVCPRYMCFCLYVVCCVNICHKFGFPSCILRPIFKISSFKMFNWCSKSFTSSVVRATSSANLRSDAFPPSKLIPFSSSWAFLKHTLNCCCEQHRANWVSLPHAS